MARSVRAVSAPQGRPIQTGERSFTRMQSGSMGAPGLPMDDGAPLSAFEAPMPPDADWQAEIRNREAAAGLPALSASPASHVPPPFMRSVVPTRSEADLTGLPDSFSLEIERKGTAWKITAPSVHAGLWKAGENLPQVVEESLAALAEMVRLDGPSPKRKRKT